MKDVLICLNLSLWQCQGQCYDGAANMAGVRNGVAKMFSDEESRPVFTHCYGHVLNLASWGLNQTVQGDEGCIGHHLRGF